MNDENAVLERIDQKCSFGKHLQEECHKRTKKRLNYFQHYYITKRSKNMLLDGSFFS